MRVGVLFLVITLWATIGSASEKVDRLMDAIRLEQVIDILRSEGREQAKELNETLLGNSGGSYFSAQLDIIYDAEWMHDQISDVFQESLTEGQLDRAIVFYESDLGQTLVSLENSAREAIGDETILEMAKDSFLTGNHDVSLYRLIDEYIEVNDLIAKNVHSAISADFQFFRGLNEDVGADDQEILAQLLTEKDAITQDTETWLYSFLLMAYQPLEDGQMRENIAFSRTETGRAVNKAFFDSFDQMYDDIYYRLGQAVSHALTASEL